MSASRHGTGAAPEPTAPELAASAVDEQRAATEPETRHHTEDHTEKNELHGRG